MRAHNYITYNQCITLKLPVRSVACVTDYHPVIVGQGIEAADHMRALFEAVAANGFWILPNLNSGGINAFLNEVVPFLHCCGLFPPDYEDRTLREHLGAWDQYRIDSRVCNLGNNQNNKNLPLFKIHD